MANWNFYGRTAALDSVRATVHAPHWFFCRVQGRTRIGKTALLTKLASAEEALAGRMVYAQIPNSDERDVVATFRRALEQSESETAQALISSVTDFMTMAEAIGTLCRGGLVVVLDEFQYFTRAALSRFTSFLQAQVDLLRDTHKGGLFVLGSLQSEMNALLEDKGAPLYGRLTAQLDLDHWDFEDLTTMFREHSLSDPYQWLTLWSFFEGVPKFYRDAYEQDLFSVQPEQFSDELLKRMFLMSSSPLTEEANTWFLREVRGKIVSLLSYLADNPGCSHGDLVAALNNDSEKTPPGTTIMRLVNNYHMVDKRMPVFSDSKSRSARYYITDNFLQGWLAVAKPARETARVRPLDKALAFAVPRLQGHEGFCFEKLIRQIHVECSKKGKGDFELTDINLGFWNRPRDVSKEIEIDVVALNEEQKRVRFGSCKRSPGGHDAQALNKFEQHIGAFLHTREGKKLAHWEVEKVLFSPKFPTEQSTALTEQGYRCLDLNYYAKLF